MLLKIKTLYKILQDYTTLGGPQAIGHLSKKFWVLDMAGWPHGRFFLFMAVTSYRRVIEKRCQRRKCSNFCFKHFPPPFSYQYKVSWTYFSCQNGFWQFFPRWSHFSFTKRLLGRINYIDCSVGTDGLRLSVNTSLQSSQGL